MPASDLTIIVPIKGRVDFTIRWLDFAEAMKFPFKIVLADGGGDRAAEEYISSRQFKIDHLKYIRYPEDKGYIDYYKKIYDALSKAETEFCILADNDDFYDPNGLILAIEFLKRHPDYVACGGRLNTFKIADGTVWGTKVSFQAGKRSTYTDDDSSVRVTNYLMGGQGPYYSVVRREVMLRIWNIICEQQFNDIRMPELLLDTFLLSEGKVWNVDHPFYYRQVGIGIGNEANLSHDFFDEIFEPKWSIELNYIVDLISEKCEISRKDILQKMKVFLAPRFLNGISFNSIGVGSVKTAFVMLCKLLKYDRKLNLLKYSVSTFYERRCKLRFDAGQMIEDFLNKNATN